MMAHLFDVPRDGTVFLFPGQGISPHGALANLYDDQHGAPPSARAEADRVVREIDNVATAHGYGPVRDVLLAERSSASAAPLAYGTSQLAHFAASVALAHAFAATGIAPDLIVGHSLGEFSAFVAAGAFSVAEGAELVCALNDAYRPITGQGTMVLVLAGERDTRAMLADTGREDLAIACVNSPRETIVSGPNAAVAALRAAGNSRRLFELDVPYAAHHPALSEIHGRFIDNAKGVRQRPLRVAVHSPVQRRSCSDADDFHLALADCITEPVYFAEAVNSIAAAADQQLFIELGAGETLSRCVRATVRGARTIAPLAPPKKR
ncbi:acyltransferase domain-containing protein [Kitasatospora purpeofusca]|uniref:acyltransferase domain-containing protein n=1 Tax=Kitasatospora purpeofusca TaxID=67352 RepID=UPI002E1498AB|nr:acyltransferase domain-containing protein [Kitasatospora purpeofusca]WSR37806.1 acyltransferase domain-containing protein [Kitasatospora purpeofusca]